MPALYPSAEHLPLKTQVFIDELAAHVAGILAEGTAPKVKHGNKRLFKSPASPSLSYQGKEILQKSQCVAGDAVLIAPVSGQVPCKQGILQGISRFWALKTCFVTRSS